jgi:mannosyltransferase
VDDSARSRQAASAAVARGSARAAVRLPAMRHPEILVPASLSLVLGLVWLGTKSWWWDEAYDVSLARTGWFKYVLKAGYYEPGQFLYLIVLKLWRGVTPETEWFTRFPSVVFACAAAALVGILGTRLYGRAVGVVAGVLMATNASVVEWSQATRTYTLAALAAVAVTLLFLRAVESEQRRRWLEYGIAAGVGFYAHFFVVFVVAAHAVLVPRLSPAQKRLLLQAWGIVLVAILPSAPFVVIGGRGGLDWIPATSWHGLRGAISTISGFNPVLLGAAVVGAAIAFIGRGELFGRWKGTLLVAWVVTPIVGVLLASEVKPLLVGRYLLVASPALALLGAVALCAVRPRWLTAAVALVLLGVSARQIAVWYRAVPADWRGAAHFAAAAAENGATVALYPTGNVDAYRLYAPLPAQCAIVPGHSEPRCHFRASGSRPIVITTEKTWRRLPGARSYEVVARTQFGQGVQLIQLKRK